MQDSDSENNHPTDDDDDDDLKAAEQAFEQARAMPKGPERILALKQAGKMRYDAEKRHAAEEGAEKTENDKPARGWRK